jgi:hypothetical protein
LALCRKASKAYLMRNFARYIFDLQVLHTVRCGIVFLE